MQIRPVEGPSAWDRRTTPAEALVRQIPAHCIGEAMDAMRSAKARGLTPASSNRSAFALPRFGEFLREVRRELESGRGFQVLRGLEIDQLPEPDVRLLYWGICCHLGMPLSQSRNGEFIGEVRDIGVKKGQADSRAYRTGGELRFHMDRCDVLGLLCVRDALEGGLSKAVSSAAVHNEVLRRRPDLLATLYQPFSFSRQSEGAEGEQPWFVGPVYSQEDGNFASQFSLTYIESAQRYPEVPRLTPVQDEAIRFVASVAEELCTTFRMESGDLQFLNNHVMYHARTSYRDHEEFERKRLLFRIWLATPQSRRLPADRAAAWGDTAPGSLRGGVIPALGARFAFPGWAAAGWSES